jgi:multiple antibiotic resistance protein
MLDAAVFLNAFTALFVIIDPIGAALIFHSLNPPHEFKYRIIVALKVFCFSLLLLIGFGVYGKELLAQLGISIAALRIAGGILLFYTAFHMITRELRFDLDSGRGDISVFPMSIPLVAGPGSLTVCILLFSSSSPANTQISVVLAVIAVCALCFVLMLASPLVKRLVGRSGDEILRRFLGVLLAALAIQFIMDGVSGFGLQG